MVLVVLLAAGSALATSGVGTLVVGDDGRSSARTAAQPLGALAVTSPAQVAPNDTGDRPDGSGGGVGHRADGDNSLPFTSVLAILVLLVGAGLLLSGVGLRRRSISGARIDP